MRKLIIYCLVSGLLASFLPILSMPAAAAPINGLTVSPAIEQLALTKGQTDASFTSRITNNTKAQLIIDVATNDFTSLNNTGGISFFTSALSNSPHGLANWMRPAFHQLALAPGATQSVLIDIPNVQSLAPGGHYGAVIYKVVSSGSVALGNKVSVNQEVSSLVFLTTSSGGTQAIQFNGLSLGALASAMPQSVNMVFTNTGNTQTSPQGLITVTGPGHKEVARGAINVNSGLILPGTSRLYSVALTSEHKLVYPGIYHLRVVYSVPGAATTMSYTKSFLFVNQALLVVIGLVILAFIVIAYRRSSKSVPKASKKP